MAATSQARAAEIIGCLNLSDNSTRGVTAEGNCYWGKGYANISIPGPVMMEEMLAVHGSMARVINRLPIYNAESGFNHSARGVHKFGVDCGIIQMRDIFGGCSNTAIEQMMWLENRINQQLTPKGSCRSQLGASDERKMRCVYARHRGDKSAFAPYPNKLAAMRLYYINYFNR
jgi:hypothetical protein